MPLKTASVSRMKHNFSAVPTGLTIVRFVRDQTSSDRHHRPQILSCNDAFAQISILSIFEPRAQARGLIGEFSVEGWPGRDAAFMV